MTASARAAQIEVPAIGEAIEGCYRRGWTDGLPVVPPTVEGVAEMLAVAGLSPKHVLGEVPVRRRVLTAEPAAANAVMAGCSTTPRRTRRRSCAASPASWTRSSSSARSSTSPSTPPPCLRDPR